MVLMINELIRVMPGFVYSSFVSSKDFYPLIVFFLGYIMLIGGFLFSIGYLKYHSFSPHRFFDKSFQTTDNKKLFVSIFSLTIFLIVAGLFLYDGLPSLVDALVGLVLGDDIKEIASTIGASRKYITKSHIFGGEYRGQGLIRILQQQWWPFIISLALTVYWIEKRKRWLMVSLAMFLLSFVFIAGDGTRGPFVETIVLYIILYSYMRKITWRFLAGGSGGIILVAILMSLYSPKMGFMLGEEEFVTSAIGRIMKRILVGNSIHDVYAIEFIRDGTIEYRLGALHVKDFEAAMPGRAGGKPFAYELYVLENPQGHRTTYASGTYISKAFVDFGISGVGIIYFIMGIGVGILQRWIFATRKDSVGMVMIAVLSLCFGNSVITGPISVVICLALMLMLYVPIKCFLRMKWGRYSNIRRVAGKAYAQGKELNA
jgi:oligosaccharide repeat unit polymerase